jgi:dihydrofolate reductase
VRVTLIAAVALHGVLGRQGNIPWRLPSDLRRFRALTLGKPIIMGRKTWDSLGRALDKRWNIVVSRDPAFSPLGATRVGSLQEALAKVAEAGVPEVFVIGGAQIFAEALPHADRIELTEIANEVPGDVFFPPIPAGEWKEIARSPAASEGSLVYTFVTFERIRSSTRGLV